MHVAFGDTQPAEASAAMLFEVITDYPSYPRFNPAVTDVRVVRKDDAGAEFVATRKTWIGRRVRAYDRYVCHRDLVVERTYEGAPTAQSTWTIHPLDGARATLSVEASQDLGPIRGLVMKPFLKKLFCRINFAPFIQEAERRTKEAATR